MNRIELNDMRRISESLSVNFKYQKYVQCLISMIEKKTSTHTHTHTENH